MKLLKQSELYGRRYRDFGNDGALSYEDKIIFPGEAVIILFKAKYPITSYYKYRVKKVNK